MSQAEESQSQPADDAKRVHFVVETPSTTAGDLDKPPSRQLSKGRVDLLDCRDELNYDPKALEARIRSVQSAISLVSAKMKPAARYNYELETSMSSIEHQIHLFKQKIISIDDVAYGAFSEPQVQEFRAQLVGQKLLHAKVFNLLYLQPHYLACLCNIALDSENTHDLIKTVLFDLYGEQYDHREEELLLKTLQLSLSRRFEQVSDLGSVLRANTPISKMLSVYARRGEGLHILREILEKPIREVVGRANLNLEINPIDVYKQVMTSYEAKMKKQWQGTRNPMADEAAANKYVKRLIPTRVEQIEYIAQHILSRILDSVERIPYGMRWLCKQMARMAEKKFPNAEKSKIGGLVGGYMFLRYFNPVIVNPESVGFVEKKLTTTMRRNLILISQVLQNLSNGTQFRDKHKKLLTPWVERNKKDIETYFARLIDVGDLSDRMDVDNILERPHNKKRRDCFVQTSYNQIYLMQKLLIKHEKEWKLDANDPMCPILAKLGAAPEKLKRHDNHIATLKLDNTLISTTSTSTAATSTPAAEIETDSKETCGSIFDIAQQDPFVTNIREHVKNALLSPDVPQSVFEASEGSLKAYLEQTRDWAQKEGQAQVALLQSCEAALKGVSKCVTEKMGAHSNDWKDWNKFLLTYVNEIREVKWRVDRFGEKVKTVTSSMDAVNDYGKYLDSRFLYYQKYLQQAAETETEQKKQQFSRFGLK